MEKKHFLGKISLDIFPPERATPIYERDKQFLAAHENQVIYEQAQPNEKGELRDYVVTKSKFFNPDSSFGGFVGITFDITERKKLENNLLQINKELAYKNHQITSSIEYASQIQNGILMDEKEIIEHFKEAFIFFQPKDIVSGDFYWFAKRDSIDFIAAVDCTGHGVPGALMTVLGNDFLNQIVYEQNITRPDLILSELDAKIKNTFHKRNPEKQITDGMELALCAIHRKTKQLYFSGARRPLWLARKNEIRIIPFSRFPISGKSSKKEKKFELHKLQIQKNDVLYLFTDGLQHQFDKPHGQKFSEKRLLKLLTKISSLSLKQQEKEVKMAFNKWKKNNFQTDDVLLIGVQPI